MNRDVAKNIASRHGRLAQGNVSVSVVVTRDELEIIKAAAKLVDRSVSKWCAYALHRAAEEFIDHMTNRDPVAEAMDRHAEEREEYLKLEEIDKRYPDLVGFAPPVKKAIAARRARLEEQHYKAENARLDAERTAADAAEEEDAARAKAAEEEAERAYAESVIAAGRKFTSAVSPVSGAYLTTIGFKQKVRAKAAPAAASAHPAKPRSARGSSPSVPA